jgi:hypothetical protein
LGFLISGTSKKAAEAAKRVISSSFSKGYLTFLLIIYRRKFSIMEICSSVFKAGA